MISIGNVNWRWQKAEVWYWRREHAATAILHGCCCSRRCLGFATANDGNVALDGCPSDVHVTCSWMCVVSVNHDDAVRLRRSKPVGNRARYSRQTAVCRRIFTAIGALIKRRPIYRRRRDNGEKNCPATDRNERWPVLLNLTMSPASPSAQTQPKWTSYTMLYEYDTK